VFHYFPILVLAAGAAVATAGNASDYAVVVSAKTYADSEWKQVVTALVEKHGASLVTFEASVDETLPALRRQFPRFVCFVAQPGEAGRGFVAKVHRLTRRLDDDPYTDCFWGILTGYDAAAALRVARVNEPLTVRKVAAGTDIALNCCEQGSWYCELQKNRMVRKEPGKAPIELKGPDDTTSALAGLLTDYHADLFVTSGHATEHDWQIGYRYRNGSFRCAQGRLFGLDSSGLRHPIESPNPKVYLPVGNCLMGHIDGPDAMALAFMNSAGVCQMAGYTVTTWYGYAGWGCLDYFVEQPGRYTFTEAVFANFHALIHRLVTYFPEVVNADLDERGRPSVPIVLGDKAKAAGLTRQDALGLLNDRDTVAFYGDPAWAARMATMETAWDQTLTEKDGVWTLEIRPNRGARTFEPINRNGSQRGGRPLLQYLPCRIKPAKVLEGAELEPVITDDFVLVPKPKQCPPGGLRVAFKAERAQ
jgi:zinc protease